MPLPVVCNVSLTENSEAISVRVHSQAKVIDLGLNLILNLILFIEGTYPFSRHGPGSLID